MQQLQSETRNLKLETELWLVRLKERDVEMIGTMALTAS